MRFIRITTNYPSYINQFYNHRPNLKNKSYKSQYKSLTEDCFGWANFWTNALRKLDYEVWEPIGNAQTMQKTWAKEHGISYHEKSWLTDIITAQVKHFRAEIVFADDYATYDGNFLHELKEQCPSIRLIIGWCGAPYQNRDVFKSHDIVLSNIPSLVAKFRDDGLRSEYMMHAFEPKILDQLNLLHDERIDFLFIGMLSKAHEKREQLLTRLALETSIEICLEVQANTRIKKIVKSFIYQTIKSLKTVPIGKELISKLPKVGQYSDLSKRDILPYEINPVLKAASYPAIFGLSMYQKLNSSLVTLNTHIDISNQFASNMRLFEATGVGTCLLTDWKSNLAEMFEPDYEVVTYKSDNEALEKIKYLLNNKNVCQKIALAGQKRTLNDHTFDHRAKILDGFIKANII